MKKKVLVCGCNGHMGQIVWSLVANTDDMEVVCGFDTFEGIKGTLPVYDSFEAIEDSGIEPDVIIDFSSPTVTTEMLKYAWRNNIPVVLATTGLTDVALKNVTTVAKDIPVFKSSNMSVQVNLMTNILVSLAKALPDAEVEITETHHNRKKDAPSGTALLFANAIKDARKSAEIIYGRTGKRKENEIGICSKRGGNIVGTHTVEFFSPSEELKITHIAHSRDIFADGAITAARFLIGKEPGLYNMDDLV